MMARKESTVTKDGRRFDWGKILEWKMEKEGGQKCKTTQLCGRKAPLNLWLSVAVKGSFMNGRTTTLTTPIHVAG